MHTRPPTSTGISPGTGTASPFQDNDRQRLDRQAADKRERRRIAQRNYRRRYDAGKFTVAVEVDLRVVDMLRATVWLKIGDIGDSAGKKIEELTSADRKTIGAVLAAMLADAAKR
jgi:hypothetical protein